MSGSQSLTPMTVAFETLGCKLNQYDTAETQALLEAGGFRTVPFESPAQVYVINTCTVTARADYSGRQAIRRAIARNPGAVVVVTGCYAQTNPDAVAGIPGVDIVLGTRDREALPELLAEARKRARPLVQVSDVFAAGALPVIPLRRFAPGYTRAFVKVQDGCQHRCSFCIVPFARGGSRSQPVDVVVDQVEGLVAAGYAEVVLTGVDLGHYGWDLTPRTTLAALVRRLLDLQGLRRLRLSSVLPAYFTEELIELIVGERRICRHLHVPLQSGADRVLRAMRRPYTVRHVPRPVERLAGAVPDLARGRRRHHGLSRGDGRGLRGDRGPGRHAAVHVPPRVLVLGPTRGRRRPDGRRRACPRSRSGGAPVGCGGSARPRISRSAGRRSAGSIPSSSSSSGTARPAGCSASRTTTWRWPLPGPMRSCAASRRSARPRRAGSGVEGVLVANG